MVAGDTISQVPLLEIQEDFWERAGRLRAKLLAKGRKARLADVLIAQSCLDQDVPWITRDKEFRNFAAAAGPKLLAKPGSPP